MHCYCYHMTAKSTCRRLLPKGHILGLPQKSWTDRGTLGASHGCSSCYFFVWVMKLIWVLLRITFYFLYIKINPNNQETYFLVFVYQIKNVFLLSFLTFLYTKETFIFCLALKPKTRSAIQHWRVSQARPS